MFSISTGILPRLAQAFAGGDDDLLAKLIENKIEDLGKGVLANLMPATPDFVSRIEKAIETGGASEFARMRNQWLSSVTPAPIPGQGLFNKISNTFESNKQLLSRPGGEQLTWVGKGWNDPNKKWERHWSATGGHWRWDKSRQQWLDVSYRFDWRTQRRDYHGRWTAGRTRFPYVPKQQRKLRSARRRVARRMARQIMQEMNRRGS